MKKSLKIIIGVVAGILLLLLVLPFLFVGKIESRIKDEVNKQLNATVGWDGVSLSFIRNFPDLTVGIENLSVVGKGQFEKDTLAAVGQFKATVNLKSLFGDNVEIKEILLDKLLVNTIIAADSAVNWDIMLPSTEPETVDTTTSGSSFIAKLQKAELTDGRFYFTDKTSDLALGVEGISASMAGDLGASVSELDIEAAVKNFFFAMEKTTYMKGVTMNVKTGLVTDMDKFVFTFKDADLLINQLELGVDGSFGMPNEGFDLDLRLFAKKTDFKTLLGLLPAEMLKDFESVQTTGKLALEAKMKGLYVDTGHLPAFDLLLSVEDASVKYPDLPESVKDIQILTKINNPGGSLDATVTDISKFHFVVAGNPFDASLNIVTPISNATFKGAMKGVLDLTSLKKALPLDSMTMAGIINANLSVAADYNMIEKELYEQIKADGNISMKSFEFQSADLPMPFYIDNAAMNFSPKYVELASFNSRLGKTDFTLSGRLENYLAYALKDGVLRGNLSHYSKNIDTDELMSLAGPEDTTAVADTSTMELVIVPKNIDFVLASKIDKLTYDKLTVNNANGKIVVKDGRVLLDGLKVDLLGGSMLMSGQYNTQDEKKPFIDFDFDASKINISQAVNSFSVIDSILPIAKLAQGIVSTKFNYSGDLGKDMMPVLSSVNGLGKLVSEGVEVSGSKVQAGLVSMLKDEKYNKFRAEDLLVNFKLDKGNLIVSPFNTKIYGKTVNVQGRQGIDKSIEYKMALPLSREEVSKMGSLLGASISTKGDDLPIEIIIKGTVAKPQLSVNVAQVKEQVKEELKQEVQKVVEQEAEKAVEKLKSDPNVQKGVEDAKKKLKDLLK
ncbi:MAG: AsmA family protein [Breznakibacter sp.]